MSNTYLDAMLAKKQKVNPLFNHLKARLTCAENGVAEIVLPTAECLTQGGGFTAGGVLATLADEAMAHAVIATLKTGESCVTSEMNIRYLRTSNTTTTEFIRSRATVLKRGRQIVVCNADIYDDKEQLLATSGGTFYVFLPQQNKPVLS